MDTVYEPGIHSVSAEEYHADPIGVPSLSASIAARLVNFTPAHAQAAHPRLNPDFERTEKSEFDIGTLAHTLLLEGHADRVRVLEFDSYRKKDAQEARDEARAEGLIPVLAKDFERVEAAVNAIRPQLMARTDVDPPLLTDGKPEMMLVWEEKGVTCRALLDWLRDDFSAIDDLKTTGRPTNPATWAKRTLWAIGADVQVAFYLRGLKALTGKDAAWRYILAETVAPFQVSVVSLDPSALELGQAKVERAIDRWRECLENDDWPGYPESIYYAEAPAWAELQFLELDAEVMTS